MTYAVADLRDWQPERPVDVLVSNATLQWIPGHLELLPSLVAAVAPGGWFAFQVPGNFDEPSHTIRAELAAEAPYAEHTANVATPSSHDPAVYYDALTAAGCSVDVWETTYTHVLRGRRPRLHVGVRHRRPPDPAGAAERPAAELRGGVQAPAGRGLPGPCRRHGAAAVPAGVRGGPGRLVRLHHVQVCCPRGGEADARRFYGEGLGMTEVEKPAELAGRGGAWFRAYDDDGRVTAEVHVGVEEPFAPARKAHPALLLPSPEVLEEVVARLERLGYERGPQRVEHVPGLPQGARERRIRQSGRTSGLTCSGRRSNRNRPVDSTLFRRGPSLEPVVFLGGSDAGVTQAEAPTSTGTTQVVNRIKRAQGQLSGVLRMLEEGRDLQEIVNQLKAVSRALDRAGFAIIAVELRESARKGAVSEEELDQLERFFLSLA